MKARVRQESS